MFLWQDATGDTLVIGILDGHGRDLGQLASATAKASMLATIARDGACAAMRTDMAAFMHELFRAAHEAVRSAFHEHHAKIGWEVKDEASNAVGGGAGLPAYLLKRRVGSNGRWDCVHGGSTATVAIVIDGRWLHIAHVGDSSAVLSGSCLTPATAGAAEIALDASGAVPSAIDLCYDHSPEAPAEFRRVRSFRPSSSRPGYSEVNFVYDSLSFNKAACPDIFSVSGGAADAAGETITVTNAGKYYKNVRSEWASLVCTPSHAAHQDALAFTRSIGAYLTTRHRSVLSLLNSLVPTRWRSRFVRIGHGDSMFFDFRLPSPPPPPPPRSRSLLQVTSTCRRTASLTSPRCGRLSI